MSDSREQLQAFGWNTEQILVYIWQCMSGETPEFEYPYQRFSDSEMGRRLRVELEALLAAQGGQEPPTDPYERVFGIKPAAPPVQGAGTPPQSHLGGPAFNAQASPKFYSQSDQSSVEALRERIEAIRDEIEREQMTANPIMVADTLRKIATKLTRALAAQEKDGEL